MPAENPCFPVMSREQCALTPENTAAPHCPALSRSRAGSGPPRQAAKETVPAKAPDRAAGAASPAAPAKRVPAPQGKAASGRPLQMLILSLQPALADGYGRLSLSPANGTDSPATGNLGMGRNFPARQRPLGPVSRRSLTRYGTSRPGPPAPPAGPCRPALREAPCRRRQLDSPLRRPECFPSMTANAQAGGRAGPGATAAATETGNGLEGQETEKAFPPARKGRPLGASTSRPHNDRRRPQAPGGAQAGFRASRPRMPWRPLRRSVRRAIRSLPPRCLRRSPHKRRKRTEAPSSPAGGASPEPRPL
jgi:hypothetical protein